MTGTVAECPHCFNRVMATSAGICPACRRSMTDRQGADTTKTSLTVVAGAALPELCCDCATWTDRFVTVRSKLAGDSGSRWATVCSIVFSLLTGILVTDDRNRLRRTSDTLVIRMPQCHRCATQGPPRPIRVNSEELRLTFVVHREFQQRVARLNDA